MSIPGNANPLLLASAAADAAAAGPTRSLRFNPGDSAYLNKTFSSGNRKTFTFSYWVKESGKGTSPSNNPHVLWSGADASTRGGLVHRGTGSDASKLYIFNQESNSTNCQVFSNSLHRDFSAWKHIVWSIDTTQSTSTNRVKLYINGVQETLYFATTPAQNLQLQININQEHRIGRGTPDDYGNFYLADVHFIDGSALDATSFGAYDDSGAWQVATYSGTFGTNGFHLLDFANESTVGHDSSGNNNDFTANNISTSAGAGNDVLFDVPTNGTQSDTGAGGEVSGNYASLNPLSKGSNVTLSNGNLVYTSNDGATHANKYAFSTIAVSSGKWYVEATCDAKGDNFYIGVMGNVSANYTPSSSTSLGFQATGWGYWTDGDIYNNGSVIDSAPAVVGVGDVVGVALDVDNRTVTFYKNGTQQGSTATSLTADATWMFASQAFRDATVTWNFGQRAFAYSAPSGYKALCTTNLPTPTIADGSAYFNAVTYTGNNTARSITGVGHNPDWVWIKDRSSSYHILTDSVRGVGKQLYSNTNDAEASNTDRLTSFDSDGFSIAANTSSGGVNTNNAPYVAWCWDAGTSTVTNTSGSVNSSVRANPTAGFSIVTYSATGSNLTVGHGLNAQPAMIWLKTRNSTGDWLVMHESIGVDHFLKLNLTQAKAGPYTNVFTSVSSSTFGTGNDSGINSSGQNKVAYCFAPVAGYSAFGSYTGDAGSSNFVHLGFRAKLLIIKRSSDGSNGWHMADTARSPENVANEYLYADTSGAEETNGSIDILSNGFCLKANAQTTNNSGVTYVYMAWAKNPFQANGGLAR